MSFESIQDLFCRSADRFGPRIAVEQGDRRTTYEELETLSNRLANGLLAQGAEKGDRVAIVAEDRAWVVVAILGALKAGCAFVPCEPSLPVRRLAAMIDEVRPRWIVVESRQWPLLEALGQESGLAARAIVLDGEPGSPPASSRFAVDSLTACTDARRNAVPADPDDRCYCFFTSGSTGRPKGIIGRLKGIDHFVRWEIETFGIAEGARVSQLTTPSFDAFLRDVFVALTVGGTVCAPADRQVLLDPVRLVGWLAAARVELIHCVPSVFRTILRGLLSPESFPALRHVLLAGEVLPTADVRSWRELFGDRIEIVNLYGPSETTMTKLFHRVTAADAIRPTIPIGKPMKGAAVVVVDAKGLPCAPGQVGEILIRTPYMSHGYWEQPELTDRVFIANPFSNKPGDLVYKTGDLGRLLADGSLEFLGRRDQQVKIRGVRIEIDEIESLIHQHPAVADAAVAAPEDAGGERILCAYVVFGGAVETGAVRELLAARLPEAMIPSHFVPVDELPRTLSGKIDRKALPLPAEARAGSEDAFQPPRNAIEELVLGIWLDVLRLERIGIHERFFEWGGHSLLATQVLARVRQIFDVELPLRDLFERPTIAGLAQSIDAALRSGRPLAAMVRLPWPGDVAPPSFAQQRLWFVDQIRPGSSFFNICDVLRLRGGLDIGRLAGTLTEVVRRHEALRTVFAEQGGQPVQVVRPPQAVVPPLVDLADLPRAAADGELQRQVREETARPFDLARGPLVRWRLFRTAADEHVMTSVLHHAVGDWWSVRILLRELTALYETQGRAGATRLPELPLQYRDFAAWQRDSLQGETLAALTEHWRKTLEGAPAFLDLRYDTRAGEGPAGYGGELRTLLPPELASALRELGLREGATLFMILLAALQVLLASQTGQRDVVVSAPISFRNWPEVEGLIGFFANTLLFRADLSGSPTFRQALARVRQAVLAAYAHQHLPLEKVIEAAAPERDPQRRAFLQVGMNYIDHDAGAALRVADLEVHSMGFETADSQFELNLVLVRSDQGISGRLQYRTDLFEAASIDRILHKYRRLLVEIADRPDLTLDDLESILASEDSAWLEEKRGILIQRSNERIVQRRRKAMTIPVG